MSTRSSSAAPSWNGILLWSLTAAVTFGLNWSSLALSRAPGQVASIWPGDAAVFVLMLANGGRGAGGRFLAGAVGALAAELVWGDPPAVCVGLVAANLAGIALVFDGYRRLAPVDLQRAPHVLRFLGVAACASAVSGVMAGLILTWLAQAQFFPVWGRWMLSDWLGYAVVAPPLLALILRRRPEPAARLDRLQVLGVLAGYTVLIFTVFAQIRYPILFLVPIALFAVAYLVELEGVMAAVLITVIVGTGLSMLGRGPGGQVGGGPSQRLMVLQVFLAVITFAFLPISAIMTQRRRLEQALREARAAAEADAALKSEFLADISHELRTPLASVLGFASLLGRNGRLSEEDREHAESISVAGGALLASINDILAFSELEAGRLEVRAEAASVCALARETVRLVQQHAAAKALTIDLKIEPGAPPAVLVDRGRVRQVLLNLLTNAVKFTEAGAVTIAIGYESKLQELSVAVSDTGPGLEAAQLERLFERFSRVDAGQRRRHGGVGLGLSICKGLVEAMGGAIEAQSVPGQGTTVRFRIPAPAATLPDSARAVSGPDAAGTLRPRRRGLLLVGRIAADPAWARTVLAPLGLDIAEASDGPDALALALAQTQRFDLVLVDGESGFDAAALVQALRQALGPSRQPLMVRTGAGDPETLRAAGFDGALAKPLSPEDLIGLVMGRQAGAIRPTSQRS